MNDEDQAYYNYLLEREAPRILQDAVQMAEAPGATMTDAAPVAAGTVRPRAMEGQISAISRQPAVGAVADFVGKVREFANQYEIKDWVPLLGGMSVGDLFVGKSPEEIENLAYGNFPMVMPQQSNIPVMKPGRKESVADTAFLGLDVAGLAPLAGAAARGVSKAKKATKGKE